MGHAVVRVSLVLFGMASENFNANMQDRFVKGMAASVNVPEEHVEIRSFYLEKSRRVRRLLEEGLIVNVAITTDENEARKVVANVMIAVKTGEL